MILALLMLSATASAQSFLKRAMAAYLAIDSTCVEPQRYWFTAMLQATTHSETYRIEDGDGRVLKVAPDHAFKIGPYVGYDWIVVGYQWDAFSGKARNNSELSTNLYLPIGWIDIYSRRNTNEFNIKGMHIPGAAQINTSGMQFEGLKTSVLGVNLFYVLNHRRYSVRAAYSQTTRQLQSKGSWIFGLGYNRQKVSLDYDMFRQSIAEYFGEAAATQVDTARHHTSGAFRYVSLSGGYGYNWVFAPNWVLNATGMLSVGYIHHLDVNYNGNDLYISQMNLSALNKLKVDATLRFGLVWNNSRWYAGATAIVHGYEFNVKEIKMFNQYGTFHVYAGINFDLGKRHR